MLHRPSAYWDAVANKYPDRLSLLYPKKKDFDHNLLANLDSGRILDAGCGKGVGAIYLANTNFDEIYAVDFSSRMCDSANSDIRVYLPINLRHKIHIKKMDIQALSFADGFFDVSCSFSSIDHITTHRGRDAAISELIRVTKPGGHVVITFPNSLALASILKEIDDIIITPAAIESMDIVKLMNSNGSCVADAYEYEATYSFDDMERIVRDHKLINAKITTGVMTECRMITLKTDITENDKYLHGVDYILNTCHGRRINNMIESVYNEWLFTPVERRGLRIGLVAEKSI